MDGSLIGLLLAGIAVALWLDALAARELAGIHSRRLCADSGLQWLDQSIALQRMQVVRAGGRLVLSRQYRFEVSLNGSDRRRASISLHGRRMASYMLPAREISGAEPAGCPSTPI